MLDNFKEFVFQRHVGERAFNIPKGDTLEPDLKAAMLKVSPYQPGQFFYVLEDFRYIHDADKNESTIMYKADGKFFRVTPLKGRLEYGANGSYIARLLHTRYSRCILVVKNVDLVYVSNAPRTRQMNGMKLWAWELTFTRVEIGDYVGYK